MLRNLLYCRTTSLVILLFNFIIINNLVVVYSFQSLRLPSTHLSKNRAIFDKFSSNNPQQALRYELTKQPRRTSFAPPIPNYAAGSTPRIFSQAADSEPASGQSTSSNSNNKYNARFLGKGESAIVRPGVVLLSPKEEYHHYYRHAAIFIFAMGDEDSDDDDDDDVKHDTDESEINREYIIRGVIIDHPTPFTLSETMQDNRIVNTTNPLGENLMFRGGDTGGTGVILLHNQPNNIIKRCSDEIGTSGIYQGGWDDAISACATGQANRNGFKVFFNYCEFTETELESLLRESGSLNDRWCAVEVESDVVLNEEWDRGECWSMLRNSVATYFK